MPTYWPLHPLQTRSASTQNAPASNVLAKLGNANMMIGRHPRKGIGVAAEVGPAGKRCLKETKYDGTLKRGPRGFKKRPSSGACSAPVHSPLTKKLADAHATEAGVELVPLLRLAHVELGRVEEREGVKSSRFISFDLRM